MNPQEKKEGNPISLFEHVLRGASCNLPEPLRRLHFSLNKTKGSGRFNVARGHHFMARLISRFLRLPSAGTNIPTQLTITREGKFETWKREFGDQCIVTKQYIKRGLLAERFGPLLMLVQLQAEEGVLIFKQVGAALCLGPLTVPLPRFLSPWVISRCWVNDKDTCVQVLVDVTLPMIGSLIRYEGHIQEG